MSASEKLSNSGGGNSSAITTGGSLLSTLADNVLHIIGMDTQNDWNLRQWNRENLYNLPANQVERLKKGGLNPALMYESGASGLVSAQSPQSGNPNLGVNQMLASQIALTNAQTKLVDNQAEAVEDENSRQNELQGSKVENLKAQTANLRQTIKYMDAKEQDIYVQWSFQQVQSLINQQVADAQCNKINAEIKVLGIDYKFKAEEYRQLVALYTLREQGLKLSNQEILSRIGINQKQLSVMDATIALIKSQKLSEDALTELRKDSSHLTKVQTRHEAAKIIETREKYTNLHDYRHHPERYRGFSISSPLLSVGGI